MDNTNQNQQAENWGAEDAGIPMPAAQQPQQNQRAKPIAEQPAPVKPVAPAQPPAAPAQPTPQQPAAVPAPPAPPAPAPKPQQPGQMPRPAQPQPGVPAGKRLLTKDEIMAREAKRNKKILFGCLGSFGCATIILIILIFFFVGQVGTESSYLAQALGVNQQQLVSSLILIINLFFGISAFIAFILSIWGIFKALMARHDDTVTKKRGYVLSGGSFGILIVIIMLWVSAWYYLNGLQIPVETQRTTNIITVPESTINLTAPVEITFDASKLAYDSRNYDIIMYMWDFGDGRSGPGTSVEKHTYEKKGTGRYDAKLILTFKHKQTGAESQETLTQTITIADEKVLAVIKVDKESGTAPLTVVFNGNDSIDPDGKIAEYSWEVDGTGFQAGQATFERTFEQIGTYTVRLRVTNDKGDYDIAEIKINVGVGDIPTAVLEILGSDDGKYYVNKTYTFDAIKSLSPVGAITKYEWNFGDGTQSAKTRSVLHSFASEGTYNVVLTVTDEKNQTAQETVQLTLVTAARAPKAVMQTVPAKANEKDNFIEGIAPFEVAFDATASTDPDNDIVDYKWDFNGDGVYDSVGETAAWVFKDTGIYTVTLNVIDSSNFEGKAVIIVRVQSEGLVPRVTAEPISGVVPLTVAFDATGSTYSDGQIVSYEWDFGDGSLPRSDVGKVTYKYSKIGDFTAKVKVKTNDAKDKTATVLISVRQVPLTSCFEPSATAGEAPLTVTFNPQCATGTISTYKWNFGDGTSSTERRPTHTFANPGSYEVTLEVADAYNVIDSSSQFITVQGELPTI
ncbi:PKD domain-containing protein [Candidatus Peregrinibacteria bacterium]|nr:PKD domain-containing protein [Candidatus Peregrinibacteria bacterium]